LVKLGNREQFSRGFQAYLVKTTGPEKTPAGQIWFHKWVRQSKKVDQNIDGGAAYTSNFLTQVGAL
jgi:hypothetical protein